MPEPGTMLEFTAWKKTQRHPIVIYADFEALLKNSDEKIGEKTLAFQNHEAMSYGFLVKANDDNQDVVQHFVDSIVEIAEKIDKLLKTNTPIIFTADQRRKHESCHTCNLCKINFSEENYKVADHCHLSGKYRQTLCNTCNLKLQTPNFLPVFFHNLSNYDAHFIVRSTAYDFQMILL